MLTETILEIMARSHCPGPEQFTSVIYYCKALPLGSRTGCTIVLRQKKRNKNDVVNIVHNADSLDLLCNITSLFLCHNDVMMSYSKC